MKNSVALTQKRTLSRALKKDLVAVTLQVSTFSVKDRVE